MDGFRGAALFQGGESRRDPMNSICRVLEACDHFTQYSALMTRKKHGLGRRAPI